jgi:hypothetical protein
MPPIQLSRSERTSLSKILERPRMAGEIPADHEEKFINYDLAQKQVLLLHITPLGQIAYLRQHFGEVKPAAPSHNKPAAPSHKNLLPPMRKRLLLTNRLQEGA